MKYRLLKDLPGVKAGNMFGMTFCGKYMLCLPGKEDGPGFEPGFDKEIVESSPEWFEKIMPETWPREFTQPDMINFAGFCISKTTKPEDIVFFLDGGVKI